MNKRTQPKYGDRVSVKMLDSGDVSSEFVGSKGDYPGKTHVDRGEATVTITRRIEDSPWASWAS